MQSQLDVSCIATVHNLVAITCMGLQSAILHCKSICTSLHFEQCEPFEVLLHTIDMSSFISGYLVVLYLTLLHSLQTPIAETAKHALFFNGIETCINGTELLLQGS